MSRPVALLSDFGTRDAYVGMVRAVLLDLHPGATLFDLTHDIPRQDVAAGSFVLAEAARWLPDRCVVWAVVDPGVGTDRGVVALEGRLGERRIALVTPDNGLVTETLVRLHDVRVVAVDVTAVRIGPSATFHGRDVFAPAAARLAAGDPIESLGGHRNAEDLVRLDMPGPMRTDGGWTGRVRLIDVFGNAITDIPGGALQGPDWRVEVEGHEIRGIVSTFASVGDGEALAYVGSRGTLEIGVRGGHAASRLGIAPLATVHVRRA